MARDPIWEILKEQGRSQAWLARQIDASPGYLRQVSSGRARPSQDLRERCARVLGIPVQFLFFCSERSTVERSVSAQNVA